MIWGLTLEPGKQYTRIMGDEIQLSMASLETREEFGSECNPPYTQVILTTKRSEYLLCTLAHGTAFQQNLDLRLRPSETVTFSVQGKNVVYLMGYSASDSEISDSIEINFEMDDTEDAISELAESERATSPALPDGTGVEAESPFTQEGNAEMSKDVPSPSTEDKGERQTEQSEDFPLVQPVSIKTEVVDSPPQEKSCHGDNVKPSPQVEPPIPQKLSTATEAQPTVTHGHLELPHPPHIVYSEEPRDDSSQSGPKKNLAQGYQRSSQSTVIQRYQTETQVSASIGYEDHVQDQLTGSYRGDAHNNAARRYPGGLAEPPQAIPVGLQSTLYPSQESVGRAVHPAGTFAQEDGKSSHDRYMACMNHQAFKVVGNFPSGASNPPKSRKKASKQKLVGAQPPKAIAYRCSQCQLMFGSLADQLLHEERDHGGLSKKQRLTCQYCGWKSQGIRRLKVHLCSHTGEKPHKCSICGKSFSQRQNQKRHERIHTGVRPYRCQVCSMTFTQNHHRKKHEEIHHQIIK